MTRQRNDLRLLDKALDRLREAWPLTSLIKDAGRLVRDFQESYGLGFGQWLRGNPALDPAVSGLSIHNIDWCIHQFKTAEDKNGRREVNNLMFIEDKRYGAVPSFAQSDTLSILDQTLKRVSMAVNKRNRRVVVRYYGLHVLCFSHSGPADSDTILWDQKAITVDQLQQLLLFQLHPRTLLPRDVSERRHHRNNSSDHPLMKWVDGKPD